MKPITQIALIFILVSGCNQRSEVVMDSIQQRSVCHIDFRAYCISSKLADFKLTLVEVSTPPIAGSAILVSGYMRDDPEKRFSAIVATLELPDLLGTVTDCKFEDVELDDCDSSHLPRITYRYADQFDGHPGLSGEKGIRVVILARRNIAPSLVSDIAYPCQLMSDGTSRCAPMLPICRTSSSWIGCRVDQ